MFEWDARKAEANIEKHKIDFLDVIAIFGSPHLTVQSRHEAEPRFVSIDPMAGRLVTVIWTQRNDVRRIISARRARPAERRAYREGLSP